MNNDLNILSELIEYLKRFELDKGKGPNDAKEFIIWLNHFLFDQSNSLESYHSVGDIDLEMTFHIIMLGKYYKMYCKDALLNTDIHSPDEYSFLYHLLMFDSLRKMELINIHLLEAPSGIEIIKRLIKKGLIEEFDDKDDKRATRIKITTEGKLLTQELIPKMNDVYSKMVAKLSTNEKIHVISFMKELNDYHHAKMKKG